MNEQKGTCAVGVLRRDARLAAERARGRSHRRRADCSARGGRSWGTAAASAGSRAPAAWTARGDGLGSGPLGVERPYLFLGRRSLCRASRGWAGVGARALDRPPRPLGMGRRALAPLIEPRWKRKGPLRRAFL